MEDQPRQQNEDHRGGLSSPNYSFGLRPRLFLAFLLVALVPLVALFFALYQHTYRQILADTEQRLTRLSEVQKRRLDTELQRLDDQLRLVASRTQMRVSLSIYNRTKGVPQQEMIERILQDALAPMEDLAQIWIKDAQGEIVTRVAALDSDVAWDIEPPDFISDADSISIFWEEDELPVIWLSGPLQLEGEHIGSLHIHARINTLLEVLDDFPFPDVVGKTLLLISDSSGQLRSIKKRSNDDDMQESQIVKLVSERGHQEQDSQSATIQHDTYLIKQRFLDNSPGTIVVYVSLSTVSAMIFEYMKFLLFLILFAFIFCALMALILTRIIARPVKALTRATRELQNGGSDRPGLEGAWGEFKVLTSAFNHAMDVIHRRTEDLHREVESSRQSQKQLAELANSDTLTGLYNRRHFMNRLDQLLSDIGEGEKQGVVLLYLDLDGFKPVNDRLGHEAGDMVLQVIAERLRHLVREQDMAARLGGDEFALLFLEDETMPLDSEALIRRAEEQLKKPMSIKNNLVQVGCSCGVTRLEPDDTPQAALNRADYAMYLTKAARRKEVKSSGDPGD
jgi:diguanylate cyclase (GGDEF)-like protein